MHEFIVTLLDGRRYSVRADRVLQDQQCITLRLDPPLAESEPENNRERLASFGATVALFDRSLVAMVIARDYLVSEEVGKPTVPHLVTNTDHDLEPF